MAERGLGTLEERGAAPWNQLLGKWSGLRATAQLILTFKMRLFGLSGCDERFWSLTNVATAINGTARSSVTPGI